MIYYKDNILNIHNNEYLKNYVFLIYHLNNKILNSKIFRRLFFIYIKILNNGH